MSTKPKHFPTKAGLKALRLDFAEANKTDGKPKHRRMEEKRKVSIPGMTTASCGSENMNGLSLKKELPMNRFRAWHRAFRRVNAEAIGIATGSAKAAVGKVSGIGGNKCNAQHFLDSEIESWFLPCLELQVAQPSDEVLSGLGLPVQPVEGEPRHPGMWAEPRHQDGAGSCLHLGVTLYGNRDLVLEEPGGEEHCLTNVPGTVYIGTLTGAHHRVHHRPSQGHDLLTVPGCGACSVTVMCRTALFPHSRARQKNTTPSPHQAFQAMVAAFNKALLEQHWRLPTLCQCLESYEDEAPPADAG